MSRANGQRREFGRQLRVPAFWPEGTSPASRLGAMRRRPPPTSDHAELVTVDIDEQMKALPVEPTVPTGPARKVLLLEDRDDFREVLRDYLVFRSYEVTSVRNGVEGLREIMKSAFDLIVCDMMMPQIGGEMFYWAVARVRAAATQRFLFFTGHQNNPAINFFFRRINATVLMKPFHLKELDSAIENVYVKLRYASQSPWNPPVRWGE